MTKDIIANALKKMLDNEDSELKTAENKTLASTDYFGDVIEISFTLPSGSTDGYCLKALIEEKESGTNKPVSANRRAARVSVD